MYCSIRPLKGNLGSSAVPLSVPVTQQSTRYGALAVLLNLNDFLLAISLNLSAIDCPISNLILLHPKETNLHSFPAILNRIYKGKASHSDAQHALVDVQAVVGCKRNWIRPQLLAGFCVMALHQAPKPFFVVMNEQVVPGTESPIVAEMGSKIEVLHLLFITEQWYNSLSIEMVPLS
jgi:hypothetical protein